MGEARITEQPVSDRQSSAEHEFGEGYLFARKELLDIPGRHAMTRSDAVHVQLAVAKVRGDIRFYRPQSRRARASLFCDPLIVLSGAEAQGDQIVNVRHNRRTKLRRVQAMPHVDRAEIAREQLKRAGFLRYQPHRAVIEIGDKRRQCPVRYAHRGEMRWRGARLRW